MSTPTKTTEDIKIKVTLEGVTRIVPVAPILSWAKFEKLVRKLFKHPSKRFSATYYDSDGDLITINSQGEFEEYVANNISSKLTLNAEQDKDSGDWDPIKQEDELSIDSPTLVNQNFEDINSQTSADRASPLLEHISNIYQNQKSISENGKQEILIHKFLQKSQKAIIDLIASFNSLTNSLDKAVFPNLNSFENSELQKFYLNNSQNSAQSTQSKLLKAISNENNDNLESLNTTNELYSDIKAENLNKVLRLIEQYIPQIPSNIHIITMSDILAKQIMAGAKIDAGVLEACLQNISDQESFLINTPQSPFEGLSNNNLPSTTYSSSNFDNTRNTFNSSLDDSVMAKSTQETSETPILSTKNDGQSSGNGCKSDHLSQSIMN